MRPEHWLFTIPLRLRSLFHWAQADQELDDELRDHLERKTEEYLAQGMATEEAWRRARLDLGGMEQTKEKCRDARQVNWIQDVLQDLHFGLRELRKNPAFAVVAVLTLALGIGANTAIFSVIESVLLQPLPFTAPEQLAHIDSTRGGLPVGGPSPMDMLDFSRSNHTFHSLAVYDTWRKNVSFSGGTAQPEQMGVGLVPAAYFRVLDIRPVVGQLFTEEAGDLRKEYVAVISESLWRNRYGGDKAIIGETIRINDEPYSIVAVIPDAIPRWMEGAIVGGTTPVEIWTPIIFADALGDQWTETGRGGRGWYSLGRMKPGVSLEQAQADLANVAASLAATHPVDRGIGVKLERLSETRIRNLRPMLFLLTGAVSLILLIACVNLANLLLARNCVRERELATRAALGAGRERLVRQLLAETLLLSLIGGVAGLVLARIGVTSLTRAHPDDLPQLASLGIDWRVLLFTVLVSMATSLIFGLGPALTASRLNLVESLKLGSRSGATRSNGQRTRNVLVVMEMAMSLMLLIGASLLVQSILRLQRQQLGIRSDHVLTGHFYLPPVRYPNPAAIWRFSDQFGDKVRALPGVLEASVTTIWPPTYNWAQMFEIPGHVVTRDQDIPWAECGFTDTHFLRTMGIPLIRGRNFSDSDSATSPPVVLVSKEFVRRYFPKEDPIGLRIHIGPPAFLNIPHGNMTMDSADVTIVGVIGDFRNAGLASPPEPQIIALYSQHPLVTYGFRDIVIRTGANPRMMVPEITRQLHAMDSEVPFAQTRTIDEIVAQATGSQRFASLLLGLFAAAGLALATVGIYGVVSFLVAQRKHEIGIRMGLGAQPVDVLRLVIGQGAMLAGIGIIMGIGASLGLTRLMASMLFSVSASDPATFVAMAILLALVALLACYIPARRAMRVDPMVALRNE